MKNRLEEQRSEPSGIVETARSTHVRFIVMGIVMAIMAVTALNRLNLSIAGKYIEEEFSFSTISMGRVFSAFLWGYGLFQIPWGYVCDRIGPRRTLTASIFCFAVGSAAMVFAPRFAAGTGISALAVFRIVRFLTGVGEAAVSSNVTRVIASWTALRERGFASGLQVCGLGLGGMMTPVAIAWTMVHWGWRVSFAISAALAFAVVALWHRYATDWPEENPRVNEQELQIIHPGWDTANALAAANRDEGSVAENVFQSVRVGLDFGLRFSRLCILRLLQLVLFLRRENARAGPDARRGMDFRAFSRDGDPVSGWRVVF